MSVRNYTQNNIDADLFIAVEGSFPALLEESVTVPGTSPGMYPEPHVARPALRTVTADLSSVDSEIFLELGRHTVVASLERGGEVLASASAVIVIGPQDEDDGGSLPYDRKWVPDNPIAPRWKLEDPGHKNANYVLWLSLEDPLYKAVKLVTRPPGGADRLPGEEFMQQVFAEGLVEWAVREYRRKGDEGGLRLVAVNLMKIDEELAFRFEEQLERLQGAEDVSDYGERQRELAAIMIEASRRARR